MFPGEDWAEIRRRKHHIRAQPAGDARQGKLLPGQCLQKTGVVVEGIDPHPVRNRFEQRSLVFMQNQADLDARCPRQFGQHAPQIGYTAAAFGMDAVDDDA